MSLILDALKRSEQERRQEPAAGPPGASAARRVGGAAHRPRWMALGAAGIAGAAAVGVALWQWSAQEPEPSANSVSGSVQPRPRPVPPARASLPKDDIISSTARGVAGEAPRRAQDDPAVPPVAAASVAGSEVEQAPRPPTVADVRRQLVDRGAAADKPPKAEVGTSPELTARKPREEPADRSEEPAPAVASPPRFDRLPYESRQALAPLRLDVHVYDPDPLRRFVMINGKTLGAGAEIKPGLAVGEIVREGVVLTWKRQAFLLSTDD